MILRKMIASKLVPLIFLGLGCSLLSTTFAQNTSPNKLIPLYNFLATNNSFVEKESTKEWEQRLIQLKAGVYGPLDNFQAKAQISFKTEQQSMVAEAQEFILHPDIEGQKSQWRKEGSLYFWGEHLGVSKYPLKIPLSSNGKAGSFNFSKFDEVWVDYKIAPSFPLCVPSMTFGISIDSGFGGTRTFVDMKASANAVMLENLTPLVKIDATESAWKERGYEYLIKRLFGLAPDFGWVYIQNKKNTLIQKSMDIPLRDVEFLDVAIKPGTVIERINLKIRRDNGYGNEEIVEFDGLENAHFSDGQENIRLSLRNALEKRRSQNDQLKSSQHFHLKEIFIYIPGKAHEIANNKPLHELVFLGREKVDALNNDLMLEQLMLTSKIVPINSDSMRLRIDLGALNEKGVVSLNNAFLQLMPPKDTHCAIRIESIRAVSTYRDEMPIFIKRIEDFNRTLGGPFTLTSSQYNLVESQNIVGILPLGYLGLPDNKVANLLGPGEASLSKSSSETYQRRLLPYQLVGLNGKSISPNQRGQLISSSGATLSMEGSISHDSSEMSSLLLEGRSRSLEIFWPLNTTVNNKTQFLFRVAEGAEQIGGLSLALKLADGSVVKRVATPNKSLPLLIGDAVITSVSLNILPTVAPFRLRLSDIILFSPSVVTYSQAINTLLPTRYEVSPSPVISSLRPAELILEPGHIAGVQSNIPISFSTKIDPALSLVHGVKIKYQLPLTYVKNNGCALSLQFNWANGKTSRLVCVQNNSGNLYIPIANWLSGEGSLHNLGPLKSIDWLLQPSAVKWGEQPAELFSLNFSVFGFTMLSAADVLRLSPLFYVGNYPVYANFELSHQLASKKFERKIWVSLRDEVLPLVFAGGGVTRPYEGQLFGVSQVVAELSQPIKLDQWSESSQPTRTPDTFMGSYTRILLLATIFLLMLVCWRLFRLRSTWIITSINRFIKLMIGRLRSVITKVTGLISCILPLVNIGVGSIVFTVGLWMTGQYGFSFEGWMLLVGSMLFGFGARCRWFDYVGVSSGYCSSICNHWASAVLIGLSCIILSGGVFGWSIKILWGAIPLIGLIYILIPSYYRFIKHTRFFSSNLHGLLLLGCWITLSSSLYFAGLFAISSDLENYLLIFGRITAVFAIRAMMLVAKEFLIKYFPWITTYIYREKYSLYFAMSSLILFLTAITLVLGLKPIANELSNLAFLSLAIGVMQAMLVIIKSSKGQ